MNIRKIALCMLMLVVACTGPRPIYHSHEKLLELVGGGTCLTEHLAQYHQSQSDCPSPQSVHCHWICCDFFDGSKIGNDSAVSALVATEFETLLHDLLDLRLEIFCFQVVTVAVLPDSLSRVDFSTIDSVADPLQILQCYCVWIC